MGCFWKKGKVVFGRKGMEVAEEEGWDSGGGEGECGGRVGMLGFGIFLHKEEFEAEVVQLGTEVSWE